MSEMTGRLYVIQDIKSILNMDNGVDKLKMIEKYCDEMGSYVEMQVEKENGE